MADHCIALRLRHLEKSGAGPGAMSRALTTGCAGLAAMTSPLLIGIMVLLAVAAVTCPFLLEG